MNSFAYTGSEFLLMDTSVRASSLSGAYTGCLSGHDGLQYNPASIGSINTLSISFINSSFLDDLRFRYLSVSKKIFNVPLALSFGMLSMNDIPIYDSQENYSKDIKYYDYYGAVGAGKNFKYFYSGINIKYIFRRIGDYSAWGLGFDIGFLKQFDLKFPKFMRNINKNNFTVGLALKNLGTKLQFEKEKESLPTEVVLGFNIDFIKSKFLNSGLFIDVGKILQDDFSLKTGVEIGYKSLFFVRVGKSFIYNDTFTGGFSFALPFGEQMSSYFGYSLSLMEDLENSHTLGVILGF